MHLKNKTVIVTGAGGTIGRALAIEFAQFGASVICVGRTESSLNETVDIIESTGGSGFAATADIKNNFEVKIISMRKRRKVALQWQP